MAWHRLKHKTSGEVQVVADLAGIDVSEWDAVPLAQDRPPTEFESVGEDGSFVMDEVRQTDTEREAAAAAMTRRQAMRATKIELIDDLLAEGVLTAAIAKRLKARFT